MIAKYLVLGVILFSTQQAFSQESIQSSPELKALISSLETYAADGASLEHFSVNEKYDVDTDLSSCRVVTHDSVANHLSKLTAEILPARLIAKHTNALKHFATLTQAKAKHYTHCRKQSCANYSCEVVDVFLSIGSDYNIAFTLGYED